MHNLSGTRVTGGTYSSATGSAGFHLQHRTSGSLRRAAPQQRYLLSVSSGH
ncbi:MAG TPA: hypothetical protein VHW26_12350 [Solirubrobacteraceae bacterium]|nr:hypothetical protein [Solirubrobacteraceae bacterium]